MSIQDLTTKLDGAPWGQDGREAFQQIASFGAGIMIAPSSATARVDWPGPVLWVCTYTPHVQPTGMLNGDVAIDFGAIT